MKKLIIANLLIGLVIICLVWYGNEQQKIIEDINQYSLDAIIQLRRLDSLRLDTLQKASAKISKALSLGGRDTLAQYVAIQHKIGAEYFRFHESMKGEMESATWAIREANEMIKVLHLIISFLGLLFLMNVFLIFGLRKALRAAKFNKEKGVGHVDQPCSTE